MNMFPERACTATAPCNFTRSDPPRVQGRLSGGQPLRLRCNLIGLQSELSVAFVLYRAAVTIPPEKLMRTPPRNTGFQHPWPSEITPRPFTKTAVLGMPAGMAGRCRVPPSPHGRAPGPGPAGHAPGKLAALTSTSSRPWQVR